MSGRSAAGRVRPVAAILMAAGAYRVDHRDLFYHEGEEKRLTIKVHREFFYGYNAAKLLESDLTEL